MWDFEADIWVADKPASREARFDEILVYWTFYDEIEDEPTYQEHREIERKHCGAYQIEWY